MENTEKFIGGNISLSGLALQSAISQLGQKEEPKGSNKGPMVNLYLKSVGLNGGYAWCQAFVHWCYDQAAAVGKVANPVVKTGGVHDCWNKADKAFKKAKAEVIAQHSVVVPGSQFILLFPNGNGHTGIVEKIENNVIYTIEGNSNDDGSREGYEVVRHKHNLTDKSLVGFIIYG